MNVTEYLLKPVNVQELTQKMCIRDRSILGVGADLVLTEQSPTEEQKKGLNDAGVDAVSYTQLDVYKRQEDAGKIAPCYQC